MDVDGSYTHRKYVCLKEAGAQVLMPSNPPPPLTGWKQVTDANFKDIAPSIPQVTSGKYYIMMFNIYNNSNYFQLYFMITGIHTHMANNNTT